MTTPYYFGYGSLVNELTLPPGAQWQRARLSGWRRSWRHPIESTQTWAAMDVLPDPHSQIDGLLVRGGGEIDAYLIERESGYCATQLAADQIQSEHALPADAVLCLWTSLSAEASATPLHLMQSYVDVVMSGYLRHFGETGLQRFVDSTDNWHWPCIDDRHAPRYPRSVALSDAEQQLIARSHPNSSSR